jgi:hypothetical protein
VLDFNFAVYVKPALLKGGRVEVAPGNGPVAYGAQDGTLVDFFDCGDERLSGSTTDIEYLLLTVDVVKVETIGWQVLLAWTIRILALIGCLDDIQKITPLMISCSPLSLYFRPCVVFLPPIFVVVSFILLSCLLRVLGSVPPFVLSHTLGVILLPRPYNFSSLLIIVHALTEYYKRINHS